MLGQQLLSVEKNCFEMDNITIENESKKLSKYSCLIRLLK